MCNGQSRTMTMGGGIFRPKKRYMGGKTLLKFFTEDIMPIMNHLFQRLGFNESRGFELFRHFAFVDVKELGTVTLESVLRYFVVEKTVFSERVLYHELGEEEDEVARAMHTHSNAGADSRVTGVNTNVNRLKRIGMTFRDFVVLLWQYCTLSNEGVARYIFEIFDVEHKESLDKVYLATIFKMLYNTQDIEEEYFSYYPLVVTEEARPRVIRTGQTSSKNRSSKEKFVHNGSLNRIKGSESTPSLTQYDDNEDEQEEGPQTTKHEEFTKAAFIQTSARQTALIRPALGLQQRLRKQTGGVNFWRALIQHRQKHLTVFDNECDSLTEALEAILQSAEEMRQRLQVDNIDSLLLEKSMKIQADKEAAERELNMLQKQKYQEQLTQEVYGKDRPMKIAWSIFEQRKAEFIEEEFLSDDPYRRREEREELYQLLDQAVEISLAYHEQNDKELFDSMTGTDEDHEARLQDYIKTPEGEKYHQLHVLFHVFTALLDQIYEKNNKKKNFDDSKKTDKQKQLEASLMELTKHYNHYRSVFRKFEEPAERERAMRQLAVREFVDEQRVADKFAKKNDIAAAEAKSHDQIFQDLKDKTIFDATDFIEKAREERRKDYIRKDFEIASKLGSRITRWEYVFNKETGKYLYINVDTLQTRHPKTAICEHCDAILVQHEMRCDQCQAPRSANNMRLFRPLGFKDITLEEE